MKLTILQENLEKAVNLASRFSSIKAQLPILSNVLISAEKTKLRVCSTNLEVSVSTEVGAKIEEDGDLCIPSKVISELVSNLPKETVTLNSEKEQLKISSTGFSSNILGINSSDFPKIPTIKNTKEGLSLPKSELIDGLSKVIFAASADETRPVLTGILFIFEKDSLYLVATDGFRLSKKKIKSKIEGKPFRLVIPKFVLSELSRVGTEENDLILKYLESEKQILFGIGDTTLSSRLLEGEYPDFEKIIPKGYKILVRVDKEDLMRVVKLASIFARESANIVKIKVLKDGVKLTAESSSSGSQEAEIEAKVERSEILSEAKGFFEIAFNYKFIEDFLHSVTGDEVVMEFSGENSAGVFKESTDSDFLHLIMPVRLQS